MGIQAVLDEIARLRPKLGVAEQSTDVQESKEEKMIEPQRPSDTAAEGHSTSSWWYGSSWTTLAPVMEKGASATARATAKQEAVNESRDGVSFCGSQMVDYDVPIRVARC